MLLDDNSWPESCDSSYLPVIDPLHIYIIYSYYTYLDLLRIFSVALCGLGLGTFSSHLGLQGPFCTIWRAERNGRLTAGASFILNTLKHLNVSVSLKSAPCSPFAPVSVLPSSSTARGTQVTRMSSDTLPKRQSIEIAFNYV